MKNNTKYTPAAAPPITQQDIDAVAAELDYLAKAKLKDGCLGGNLSGYEPDIRQTAILMALRWWLNQQHGKPGDWIPKKSISYALRYSKLRHLERIERRAEYSYDDHTDLRISEHPHRLHESDYPEHSLLCMFETILHKCLKKGSISNSNAVVARMVYFEGQTIETAASAMGRHPSAISQQLRRVRLAVRQAAKTTDPTFAL